MVTLRIVLCQEYLLFMYLQTDMLPVVVVHGGAGHIPKERAELSTIGVKEAARIGYAILQKGGSAMDAVVEAVTSMENNPRFNAGAHNIHV